ncbi:MAG: hypothetical protein Sapg2KO_46910 [Saprospiraceae bacterium]
MSSAAIAQIPQLISYQGFLTDNDRAVADGDYSITVKIFDAATDGNELWTETLTVSTINGLFATSLGAVTPFNLPFDQAYFLSTTFDGTELLPRTAMTASPYAFNSIQAGNPFALDNADDSAQEVVYVDADSKIGLGTNTPNTNVHIKSPSGVKNEVFIEPGNWSSGGDEAQITFGDLNHRITARFGEGLDFYDVNQFRFTGSSATFENDLTTLNRIGIGGAPTWRFHAQGAVADFIVYSDFPELAGETLVAGFRAKTAPGAIVRFENAINSNFVDMGTDENGNFKIEQNDVNALIVNTDASTTFEQRVGIGADPDPGALLYVNGNIKVLDDNSIFGLDGLWGFNDLRFFGDQNGIENSPDMIITAEGNVGIGRTFPIESASKLTVGNQDIALKFYPGRRGFSDDVNAFHLDMDGTKDLTLTDNFIVGNKMVIGNLGTPGDDALFVDGSIRLGADNSIFGIDALVGANDLRFFGDANGNTEDLFIGADGNVMVGATTNGLTSVSKFQVNGTDGRAALLQDSELKLLGPSTIHFSILNDQAGTLRIQDASSLAQPGTPGFNLMSIQSNGNVTIPGAFFAVSITETSDRRYKKDFTAIDQALNKVLQLDGLYYNWKVEEFPTKKFTTAQQIGFIAQDIEKLFPEMVDTDEAGYKSVNYGKLTPVLVEAIKEQQDQIDQLKAEKAAFQTELADLKANVMARLEALEQQKDSSKNSASRTSKR